MSITVHTIVNAPVKTVWECWTRPEHITQWNAASDDWHCPKAKNDVQVGGTFSYTMSSRDGANSFEFEGVYDKVEEYKHISYHMPDQRHVAVEFKEVANGTEVIETFEVEHTHTHNQQREGWQAILDRFKRYVETRKS